MKKLFFLFTTLFLFACSQTPMNYKKAVAAGCSNPDGVPIYVNDKIFTASYPNEYREKYYQIASSVSAGDTIIVLGTEDIWQFVSVKK